MNAQEILIDGLRGAVGVTAAGLMIAGPATGLLAGGGYGAYQMVSGIYRVMRDRIVRARLAVPGRNEPLVLRGRDMKRIVISANALGLLVLGLFPGGLLDLCARVLGG